MPPLLFSYCGIRFGNDAIPVVPPSIYRKYRGGTLPKNEDLPEPFEQIFEDPLTRRPIDRGSPGGGGHKNDRDVAEEGPQDPPQRIERGIRHERQQGAYNTQENRNTSTANPRAMRPDTPPLRAENPAASAAGG